MKRFVLLALCLFIFPALALAGGTRPELRTLKKGIKVSPKRIARISPDQKMKGSWHQLKSQRSAHGGGGMAAQCSTTLAFDCFEPDADGVPIGGLACGLDGEDGRWFFGPEYCTGASVNDMTVASGFEGQLSQRLEFAWYWTGTDTTPDGIPDGSQENCVIGVFTAETFDDACVGPAFDGAYDGVVYDFGPLDNDPGGYYYTDINDLCNAGLFHQLPMDGTGAYLLIFAQSFDDTDGDGIPDTFTGATCAQPMRWGTGEDEVPVDPRPGTQGPIEWDDDNPLDGTFTAPDECYDDTAGVCPDPIGVMAAFYGDDVPACSGDLDGDGCTNQVDLGILLGAYQGEDVPSPGGDFDGDGDTDQADLGVLLADYGCGGCP